MWYCTTDSTGLYVKNMDRAQVGPSCVRVRSSTADYVFFNFVMNIVRVVRSPNLP
jgi:hypothetical protein